jgi:hypothetical protein
LPGGTVWIGFLEQFMRCHRWCRLAGLALALTGFAASRLEAADPDQGFSTVIAPSFTGEELRSQEDLWALEVALKPMRMVFVPAVNPRTGAKSSEMIWYLVYKIVHRPVVKPAEAADSSPVNVQDPAPPPVCVPRAALVIEDRDIRGAIVDSIVPEALPIIAARERLDLKTSVQMSGPLPKLTSADSKHENAEYGVFMFRGVDPRTTAFSVYLSGFSNAYKIGKDESGKPLVLRRTIVIPYRRFGDQYDQFAKEIRQVGATKWVYVPDEAPVAAK